MAVDDAFTVALLHMDGGARLWTANGNAQIDTAQSKFGGASGLFDGSGDYLSTPANEDFNFGSGDFTIEGRIRFNAYNNITTYGFLFERYTDANNFICCEISGASPKQLRFVAKSGGNTVADYSYGWSANTNTWYHIAYVRNGTNFYMFIDGVSQSLTATVPISTNSMPTLSSSPAIGQSLRSGGVYFNGWMDEVRVSKGIARWTSNFTPPTSEYTTDANTVSLLHMNGTDASTTFTDEVTVVDGSNNFVDESGKTWTAAGNAQIDTAQSVFGGASGLFDGTGDYLSSPDSADWQLDGGSNSNAWTVDFRVRFNADPGTGIVGFLEHRENNQNSWAIILNNNTLRMQITSADVVIVSASNAWNPEANVWYHVAIVKNGTSGYMTFVDGVQIGTTQTDTDPMPNFAGSLNIGLYNTGSFLNGWMDELRISKGIARWTANFTPPTAPYGVSDTSNFFAFL